MDAVAAGGAAELLSLSSPSEAPAASQVDWAYCKVRAWSDALQSLSIRDLTASMKPLLLQMHL